MNRPRLFAALSLLLLLAFLALSPATPALAGNAPQKGHQYPTWTPTPQPQPEKKKHEYPPKQPTPFPTTQSSATATPLSSPTTLPASPSSTSATATMAAVATTSPSSPPPPAVPTESSVSNVGPGPQSTAQTQPQGRPEDQRRSLVCQEWGYGLRLVWLSHDEIQLELKAPHLLNLPGQVGRIVLMPRDSQGRPVEGTDARVVCPIATTSTTPSPTPSSADLSTLTPTTTPQDTSTEAGGIPTTNSAHPENSEDEGAPPETPEAAAPLSVPVDEGTWMPTGPVPGDTRPAPCVICNPPLLPGGERG